MLNAVNRHQLSLASLITSDEFKFYLIEVPFGFFEIHYLKVWALTDSVLVVQIVVNTHCILFARFKPFRIGRLIQN